MGLMQRHRIGTPNFMDLPIVFIDIETTGQGLSQGGEICEIGVVKVDRLTSAFPSELNLKLEVSNPFGKPETELSFDGYNAFNFPEWQDALKPELALRQFNDFCAGSVPWGYNISFEFKWLDDYFTQYGLDWQGDYHWFDLMTKAYMALEPDFLAGRLTSLSLSTIGKHLGLAEEARPHRGLSGARYELEVYHKLNVETYSGNIRA